MVDVDGNSKLANLLVNPAAATYTEQWSALAPAGVLMEEAAPHAHRKLRTTPSGWDWEFLEAVFILF
jgi:hypothetical protein